MTPPNATGRPASPRARGNTTQPHESASRHAAPRQNRKRTRWTPRELDLLREHYPLGGYKAVQAAGVKRSRNSITSRAAKEGLAEPISPPSVRVMAHKLAPRQPILRPSRPARVTEALHALAERAATEPGWTNERYRAAQDRIKEGGTP